MAESFLGSGDLWINRLTDAGAETGWALAGNADKFEIKPEAEVKEQISKGRDTYGQVIATATLPKPSTLAVSLNQLDKEVLSMAFLGHYETLDNSAGSLTDVSLTAPAAGKGVWVGKHNISSVTVTGKTVDTDYTVNERLGLIFPVEGGTISEGDTLTVSCSYDAEAGTKIYGATKPTIKARFKLDGKNFVNGKASLVTVWEAQVAPTSAVDFLAGDFAALELTGTMVTPTGKTGPFERLELD